MCLYNLPSFCQPTGLHLLQGRMNLHTCNSMSCWREGRNGERERGQKEEQVGSFTSFLVLCLSDFCPVDGVAVWVIGTDS